MEGPTGPTARPFVESGDRAPVGLSVKGRYRIVRELGAGAFGSVCLAEDEATGHPVAIRFLPRALSGASDATQAVQRMGRAIVAASTAHPALVRVLEFGEAENGRAFVAMELVEGRLEDGRVKLMDVELAGLRDAPAMESILAAESPAEYLSPEQIRRAPVTEKTDIYAFGVVLYEMLCGVPPFQAPTREAILTKHLTETLVPVRRRRRGVPASVESAVALALYKQPELRPLMQDVLNRLWAEANGPATRWKRPAAIAAGAALAASVVMLVAWVLFAQHVPAPRPLAQPAEQAPVSALPRSSAPPTEPGTAPVVGPLAPAVGPATPAAVPSPAVRATPPTTAPPASRPPRAERRDQPLERPAASSDAEADDPGAIIDWLLSRSSARGR
ncbi:MAG: hypothetical protein AUH99_12395 [Candidatus Rokubacteria bacterium 13_2_20CM_2_70_11]|nr:MAG: hypothetical protein AUH99_12395 [Candidatus Rokubacteria bacterium 13_2_20CM_2_70_11]